MSHKSFVGWRVLVLAGLSFTTVPVWAELRPFSQETGRISVSVDAIGTNASSGLVLVQKPETFNGRQATVRKAFLLCASRALRVINDGDVELNGNPISWDTTVFNNSQSTPSVFHNTRAEVTSIVRAAVDTQAPGLIAMNISEVDTLTIDGCVLAVIFDDETQEDVRSVILFFGGQDTLGDQFNIRLTNPIDKTDPNLVLDFGLGISHGAQDQTGFGGSHLCGTDSAMSSLVDINGLRLTSCAGNLDDAPSTEIVADGNLITVGGVGDTNDNPSDPFQQAADGGQPRTIDDELYDLFPFVSTGHENIIINTINPSDDDNIFFSYLLTSIPAAVLLDLPLPGAGRIFTDDPFSPIPPPERPTIVLTHGLQSTKDPLEIDPSTLWTGFDPNRGAGALLRASVGTDVNIFQYVWDEAFKGLNAGGYRRARPHVYDAGERLAERLLEELRPGYKQSIHFIGHSLGTAVNAYAARRLFQQATGITQAQFTILDYPNDPDFTILRGGRIEKSLVFDRNFFGTVFSGLRANITLRIDNYYTLTGGGAGNIANGPIYNHQTPGGQGLVDPGKHVGDRWFDDEGTLSVNNDHSGVHQWYRWTIDPTDPFPSTTFPNLNQTGVDSVCNGDTFVENLRILLGFDVSLNPCQKGWYWSINGPKPEPFPQKFPENVPGANIAQTSITAALENYISLGCEITGSAPDFRIDCIESSSPFGVASVDVPDGAQYLSFEYAFMNIGDGDYAAVHIDDKPIWVLSGESAVQEGEFVDSGPVPIGALTGGHTLTVALYGVGLPNAEFAIRNMRFVGTLLIPIANAGLDQQVDEGTVVTLDGGLSRDEDGTITTFEWQQTSGPAVALLDENLAIATFTAPEVTGDTSLGFQLTVTDDDSLTATDTVTVTVANTTPPPPPSSSGGGCFIATAAYGSYLDPHVETLRNFRDDYLLTNSIGTGFVHLYYKYSPPIAERISQNETLRTLTRAVLTPLVYSISYPAIPGLCLLLIMGVFLKRRERIKEKGKLCAVGNLKLPVPPNDSESGNAT